METKDILLLLVPLITAALSAFITYTLTKRAKRDEAIFKFKEEKYGNLLILIQAFLSKENKNNNDLKIDFFEEQYKSWLYSSDEVVLTINNLVNTLLALKPGELADSDVVGKIVLAMRKDMLGKSKLKPSDFKYTSVV